MSPIKQEYNSSVERRMLAHQKVWGTIPNQGVPFLFCPELIYTGLTQKLQGKTRVKKGCTRVRVYECTSA